VSEWEFCVCARVGLTSERAALDHFLGCVEQVSSLLHEAGLHNYMRTPVNINNTKPSSPHLGKLGGSLGIRCGEKGHGL
jgi:hypothetical protein